VDIETEFECAKTYLDRDQSTMRAVRGADAIVHVAEPMPDADETARYDHRMRCTYNLLWAADQQRVRNFVYLSSLRMMTGYDQGLSVDEDWQPLPTAASQALPDYLGEFTCREFAREAKLNVIVLRVGNIIWSEALGDETLDPLWVDPRDVAHAVSQAVAALFNTDPPSFGRWSVFHIQAERPQARFTVDKAKRLLGYRPQHDGSRP
jgi:nucleoside-diphosphate-sugar epimerase